MSNCPACGQPLEALCATCKKALKRWQPAGSGAAQWVHANPGGWLCPSLGEPKPEPVVAA